MLSVVPPDAYSISPVEYEVIPVPPFPAPKSPVILESSSLSASCPLSNAKPPLLLRSTLSSPESIANPWFDLRSSDNVCPIFSPDVPPVLCIPSPPVIVDT